MTLYNADIEMEVGSNMLKFLGCGAALYPKFYNSNAYFKIDQDLFLLDCGETAFRQHYIAGHFIGKKVSHSEI